MEVLRSALLPRRITQIYTDTKKFYEQIVQQPVSNPQVSSLHLKLRIQKDRLVAWGIEWADTNAQHGDIDDSLDRAGISDLVASIMSKIKELLDDAEKLQPSFQPPGRLPDQKGGFLSMPNRQWTKEDLDRLDDLVKSITTSIDTLCDLSRSTQTIRDEDSTAKKARKLRLSADSSKNHSRSSTPIASEARNADRSSVLSTSDLINSTRISADKLSFPEISTPSLPNPPSYELSTASPDNRKFAWLDNIPVLVDFGYDFDYAASWNHLPALKRFESLVLALQAPDRELENTYTGCFKILGWFISRQRLRFGFVYEIPQPNLFTRNLPFPAPPPPTLLSFLQHSASLDGENIPTLEDRFRLALNLVTNLLHTHAKGITHRFINSNNVVFVETEPPVEGSKPWKERLVRKPYLISWDHSDVDPDFIMEEVHVARLYRHPLSKIGQRAAFRPAYDLYSLGVVLLEIGLWLPIHKLWKSKYDLPKFKEKLQQTYAPKLAWKCGSAYTKVVDFCLGAAELDQPAVSARYSRDLQQTKLQESFYWQALKPLERCCTIDASNEPIVHPTPSAKFDVVLGQDNVAETESHVTHETAQKPEERLAADSPTVEGETCDVLVWSYEIPGDVKTYYRTVMLPKLKRMLARAIDRWEGYTIMTFMAGETPETAKPTLYMSCLSIVRAWKVLEYVNRDQKFFDIKVSTGQTCYSKANKRRPKRKKHASRGGAGTSLGDGSQILDRSRYQAKPSCGASISAFVDEQHLERATFGGIVLADGEPFGMSVHHMLEDQDLDQGLDFFLEPELDMGPDPSEANEAPFVPQWQAERDSQVRQFHSDDFDPAILDQDFSDEDDELHNMGDTLGTAPGKRRDQIVTQPALDDVDPAFFPNEEDKSDEHLSSHGLGYIHASSGRRQVTHGASNIAHEVDWALFKICEGRLECRNKIEGGQQYCVAAPGRQSSSQYPCRVMEAEALGGRQVHAIGATSGLAAGKIMPDMIEQKMPGRVFSSTVWRFRGNFGVGGDSGAWIVDNETGAVCGHVTAWNERGHYGVLSPMEVMLHDMERTLGKKISLPSEHLNERPSYKDQIVSDELGVLASIDEDEGIDVAGGTPPPTSPNNSGLVSTDSIGQQFADSALARETMDDSDIESSSLEGTSMGSRTMTAASTPPLHTMVKRLDQLKLDSVALDDAARAPESPRAGSACTRRKPLMDKDAGAMADGLRAQC